MTLLTVKSERLDSKGKPYDDLYLTWKHGNKSYAVRVRPVFASDNKLLYSQSIECENIDIFEKYM